MSERKVLNKYYPPDFDPNKIPRLHLSKDRQYTVRLMAPFNMRCKTCGEYIYKGKKFNARKETVQGEDYLGLKIFRFYIKCTRCVAEITFKTDPKNTDYVIEHGASRNFQAAKLAEEEAIREQKEKEEDELNNPMKVLENRTKDSKYEMDLIEKLEELKELNMRHAQINHDQMLKAHAELEEQMRLQQEKEDEHFIQSVFPKTAGGVFVKRLHDSSDDEKELFPRKKTTVAPTKTKPSDILLEQTPNSSKNKSLLKTFGPLIRPKSYKSEVSASQSSEEPKAMNGLSLLGEYSDDDSSE